jgi:hypothetical protein
MSESRAQTDYASAPQLPLKIVEPLVITVIVSIGPVEIGIALWKLGIRLTRLFDGSPGHDGRQHMILFTSNDTHGHGSISTPSDFQMQ